MDEKITVGRRFSKQDLSKKELLRIKGWLLETITSITEEQAKKLLNGELSFTHFLKSLKSTFAEILQKRSLPCDPFWYPTKTALRNWQPNPPDSFTKEEIKGKRISLDRYLLWLGYDFDSNEYLAGKALFLIHLIEKAGNKNEWHLHAIFELGSVYTLFRVYLQMGLDSTRGGKNKNNPWRAYGKQLLIQYPNKSQQQIWRKIPKGRNLTVYEMSKLEDAEPDPPDTCDIFRFYRVVDDDKEVVVAKNDKTGEVERTLAYNSFRTRYLLKKNQKN